MKSNTFYVDVYGRLRTHLKFRRVNYKITTGEHVIDKVINKLIKEERYEECIRMKKLKESLNNK
jgi:hypothetical protein